MTRRIRSGARRVLLAPLLLATLYGSTAFAQVSTSNLIGNVVDASTKAPVADVVVTATSPSLQGEQVVVTDATGAYRVPQLPPGTYTLRFEKETFRPFSRTGIEVGADKTLRLNVELLPETAGTGDRDVPDKVLVYARPGRARADVDRGRRAHHRDDLRSSSFGKELDVQPECLTRSELDGRPAVGPVGLLLEAQGVRTGWQLRDAIGPRRVGDHDLFGLQ